MKAVNEAIDVEAGTRSLTLEMTHPGVIWSVVAFDAEILVEPALRATGRLPATPPEERPRATASTPGRSTSHSSSRPRRSKLRGLDRRNQLAVRQARSLR